MTVGIAVVCDNGNAIVAAAARMRTSIMETEPKASKVESFGEHCVVLPTGLGNRVEPIIGIAAGNYSQRDVKEISAHLRGAYIDERTRKISEEILSPIGLSFEIINTRQQTLSPAILNSVYQKMAEFDLNLELLIAEINESEESPARMFILSNPGSLDALNRTDYMAIGSGRYFAYATLASNGYERDVSVNEAAYRVLEAKNIAECAPGVGHTTDAYVLDKTGTRKIGQSAMDELNTLFAEKKAKVKELEKTHLRDANAMNLF